MPREKLKLVLLGEGRVGKTSIVVRFVKGKYDEAMQSTLQASFLSKTINIGSDAVVLNIWDTAGQERFHALGPIYYRDADGALLVYDITYAESFTRVKHWVKELRKMNRSIPIAIAANKADLEKDRHVSHSEAESYCESIGAVHILTSAKTNRGLEEIFLELTKKLLLTKQKETKSTPKANKRRTVRIVDDEVPQQRAGCC
eukprot:GSMAST32.ASY1.ANO1.1603.1 assembled CDS